MAGPVIVTTDETLAGDLKASLTKGTLTLVGKLVAVMAAIDHIQKRGRNEFHKYDYATEADIAAAVRRELALRNVMLFPAITGERREAVGEKGSVLTTLDFLFTFHDGDSGETLSFTWKGAGTDKDDKGLYKAMTGGEKYFLMKTFLIPTGDDPERDDKKAAEAGDKAVRAPKPGPRAALPAGTAKIIKVVPKSKGAVSWAEVTYVTDMGEEKTHPIQADVREAGLSTVEQLCQDNATVEITTAQNSKGKTVIESVQRYRPEEPVYVELPPAKPNGAGAF